METKSTQYVDYTIFNERIVNQAEPNSKFSSSSHVVSQAQAKT